MQSSNNIISLALQMVVTYPLRDGPLNIVKYHQYLSYVFDSKMPFWIKKRKSHIVNKLNKECLHIYILVGPIHFWFH